MSDMPRLLSTFLDLVAIDSVSFEEKDVAAYIMRRLGSLGCEVRSDDSSAETGANTGNLLCSFPGDATRPRILFAMHMDTVEPGRGVEAELHGDVVTSKGETVLGADDKVGVAVSIELVERIVERGDRHGPVDLVYTVAEEKGLVGAKSLDLSEIGQPAFAYVLDAEGLPGSIILGAPYYDSVRAVFHGKAAHAGVEPELGANALTAAASAISRVRIGRIDEETTANIGTIHGGRERNIIPDRVEITGEARSLDEEKLKIQVAQMVEALRSVEADGIRVEVETAREFDGFKVGKDHPAAALAADGLMAVGITPHFRVAGGGSDANVFNSIGLPAVALSVGYTKAHAIDERVHVSDMERSVAYLLEMVRIAGSGKVEGTR